MEDLDDSVLDSVDSLLSANNSIVNISSHTIDYIDLTKESPISARPSRSRQRMYAEDVPPNHNITESSNHYHRRHLSPIVLGTQLTHEKKSRGERKVTHSKSTVEILVLDDTIEENEPSYTIESDDRKPIPLTCPICFESLSSNSKPITTRCGHVFCTECLNTYFRTAKKCPTCKSTITLKTCTRLYL